MPRPRKNRPQANSMVASAARISQRPSARPRNTAQEWQTAAWTYYDTVGELRFAINWVANAMSRVTLYVAEEQDKVGENGQTETQLVRLTSGPAVEALDALGGGEGGQSQLMHAFGTHLSTPGECYLIGEPGEEDEQGQPLTEDHWYVASTDEVSERAGKWYIDRGDGKRQLDDDTLVIRVWRHHARQWVLADSPVRAVLNVLRVLEALHLHISATIDSRLAGAGILLLPSEMSFNAPPTPQRPDGTTDQTVEVVDPADPQVDPFFATLVDSMLTAIEDRGSAAAVVPIVVKAPGATLADARHLTLHSALDDAVESLMDKYVTRLALGLDVPPEVVLGQAESNHWTAWQIEESALKVHVEPVAELVTTAILEQYLRPVLTSTNYPGDVTRLHVLADTTDLRARADHSQQAQELYDRFAISAKALRRENGMDETDAPDEEEVKVMLLRKVVMGAISPEQAAAAAATLGIELPVPTEPTSSTNVGGTPTIGPAPEDRSIPEAAALLAAGEVLVLRALERARNRMNRRGSGPRRPITAAACDLALADAWDHAPRVATVLGVDPDWFVNELDRYTRALLTEGQDHTPRLLARCLSEAS